MNSGMNTKPRHHITGSIAALNIGSTKVACFIARLGADGAIKVTGIGHQLSKGIQSGHVIDIVEAETSVVAAVHTAEQMADETIENVVVNISSSGILSRNITVDLAVSGEGVTQRDLADIISEGRASVTADGDSDILHCFPVQYTLDGVKNIREPRGMVGSKLGARLCVW